MSWSDYIPGQFMPRGETTPAAPDSAPIDFAALLADVGPIATPDGRWILSCTNDGRFAVTCDNALVHTDDDFFGALTYIVDRTGCQTFTTGSAISEGSLRHYHQGDTDGPDADTA